MNYYNVNAQISLIKSLFVTNVQYTICQPSFQSCFPSCSNSITHDFLQSLNVHLSGTFDKVVNSSYWSSSCPSTSFKTWGRKHCDSCLICDLWYVYISFMYTMIRKLHLNGPTIYCSSMNRKQTTDYSSNICDKQSNMFECQNKVMGKRKGRTPNCVIIWLTSIIQLYHFFYIWTIYQATVLWNLIRCR